MFGAKVQDESGTGAAQEIGIDGKPTTCPPTAEEAQKADSRYPNCLRGRSARRDIACLLQVLPPTIEKQEDGVDEWQNESFGIRIPTQAQLVKGRLSHRRRKQVELVKGWWRQLLRRRGSRAA